VAASETGALAEDHLQDEGHDARTASAVRTLITLSAMSLRRSWRCWRRRNSSNSLGLVTSPQLSARWSAMMSGVGHLVIRAALAFERRPPRLCDPDLANIDQFAARLDLLIRQARESLADKGVDRRHAEAAGSEKRSRRAVAARGREHGESAALFGSERHRSRCSVRRAARPASVRARRPAAFRTRRPLHDQSSHGLASNAHTLPIRTTVDAKQESTLPRGERRASRCRALGHLPILAFERSSACPRQHCGALDARLLIRLASWCAAGSPHQQTETAFSNGRYTSNIGRELCSCNIRRARGGDHFVIEPVGDHK
jgi:hypothetical protein